MAIKQQDPTQLDDPDALGDQTPSEPKSNAKPYAAFEDVVKRDEKMVGGDSARDTLFDQLQRAYTITPEGTTEGVSDSPRAYKMFDPHGNNVINACVKTYIINPPTVTVRVYAPRTQETKDKSTAFRRAVADVRGDRLKMFCEYLLRRSDEVSERSVVADALFATALFGVLPLVIDNLAAELENPADALDLECPIIFRVPHPKSSHMRVGRTGLSRHVFTLKTTMGEVRESYGDKANFLADFDDEAEANLYDSMDTAGHSVYVKEASDQSIIHVAHNLPFIPRVVRRGVSPGFFTEPELQQMPLLYGYIKAGLFAASNVGYTSLYTSLIDYLNVNYIAKMQNNRVGPKIDPRKRGQTYTIRPDEEFGVLETNPIKDEMLQFLAVITKKSEESTIPSVGMGVAPGGNVAAAAGLNILSQISLMASHLVARTVMDAMRTALKRTLLWIRAAELELSVPGEEGIIDISYADIPRDFDLTVDLRPDQQAQKQMLVGIATTLYKQMGFGYDTTLNMLERGNVIESSSKAHADMIARKFEDAELPKIAQQTAETTREAIFMAAGIPETAVEPTPPAPGTPEGMTVQDAGNTSGLFNPQSAGGLPPGQGAGAPPNVMQGQ